MNKYVIGMLMLLVFAGLAMLNDIDFGLIIFGTISGLAILAWLRNVNPGKVDKMTSKKPDEDLFTGEEGEEYHNDFSKVPAGEADSFQPPPRSIGYGYGDGGKSTYEDLERIGIDKSKVKK